MALDIDRWSWSEPAGSLGFYVAALSIVDIHNRVLFAKVFMDQIIEIIVLVGCVIEDRALFSSRAGYRPPERREERN